MERESYLIEQIESYIDQLDLLGMQKEIDQGRIDGVITELVTLAFEYANLLDKKEETKIQEVENVFAFTLEDELQKREHIHSIVNGKLASFSEIFMPLKEMNYVKKFDEQIAPIMERYQLQAQEYASDVALVQEQMKATQEADYLESDLQTEMTQACLNIDKLKNVQIPYETLSHEMSIVYSGILSAANAKNIDFKQVKEKQSVLEKRQQQLLENLELAKSAQDADGYVVTYEGRLKKNKLALDELREQIFLHFLMKFSQAPVTSYESLEKRTKTIQALIESRIRQVDTLYREGVISREKYKTVASQIDHSKIIGQLQNLRSIKKQEDIVASITDKLESIRTDIKGVEDLEEIFAMRAKERGRVATIPKKPEVMEKTQEEVEIIFEDEAGFEGYESLSATEVQEDKKRRQVIGVEPAKQSILESFGKMKQFLISKLEKFRFTSKTTKEQVDSVTTILEEYQPAIGDQIQLLEGAMIYTNPMYAIDSKDGIDVKQTGLTDTKLFVTRGAILDQTGTPIYITSEYGIDLKAVASDMKLEEGTYQIALGCSSGDSFGNFVGVSDDELNQEIEKGWIKATDSNVLIINQVYKKDKGGMLK